MKRFVKKYRTKARILKYNPWNDDAEPGDIMIQWDGKLFRLENSSGWGARMAGQLYPRKIKPPSLGLHAELVVDAEGHRSVWWVNDEKIDAWPQEMLVPDPAFSKDAQHDDD